MKLRNPEYRAAFFSEYSVLLRVIPQIIDLWLESNCEFFSRVVEDYETLCSYFWKSTDIGVAQSLQTDMGDRHCGGRAVIILKFSSGEKIVYKPRPMAFYVKFQQFLEWCNQHWPDHNEAFLVHKVLDRGAYGWSEFVSHAECETKDELLSFYWRLGTYIALFYLFHAVDMHHENLIAHGEHPVFFDLESCLHPVDGSSDPYYAYFPKAQEAPFTVANVGLLPDRIVQDNGEKGIDLSGVGAFAGQEYPIRINVLKDGSKDTARYEPNVAYMKETVCLHLPKYKNKIIAWDQHASYYDQISSGFLGFYSFLLHHKKEIISSYGLIYKLKNTSYRRIFLGTSEYGKLLIDATHPDYLRDYSERERNFAKYLFRFIKFQPWRSRIFQYEVKDLGRGDIPFFSCTFNSNNVVSSNGKTIPGIVPITPIEMLKGQLDQLSTQDMKSQLAIMEKAFRVHKVRSKHKLSNKNVGIILDEKKPLGKQLLIDHAECIGDKVAELAIYRENRPYWATRRFPVGDVLGTYIGRGMANLYSGNLGVAFFLAICGHIAHRSDLSDLSLRVVRWIYDGLEKQPRRLTGSSFFTGLMGFVFVTHYLKNIYTRSRWLEEAAVFGLSLLDNELEHSEESHSIMGGAASVILALDAINESVPKKIFLNSINKCCEEIVRTSVKQDNGIGWIEDTDAEIPLTGFAHGTAGYAAALFIGGNLLGKQEFVSASELALSYERANYCSNELNWKDNRKYMKENMFAWCHGAPGIGLSRIRMWPYANNEQKNALLSEIDIAIRGTIKYGFGQNHSLCHGDIGNLDFLQ